MAIHDSTSRLSDHPCECGCGRFTNLITATDPRRGYVKGQPHRYVSGHTTRGKIFPPERYAARAAKARGRRLKEVVDGYRTANAEYIHRARAERALGHPLPPRAVVHHADGSLREDAPLVICEDNGYHRFLHARMRIRAAGGNPNTDKCCTGCRQVKPFGAFNRGGCYMGLANRCRACSARRLRERRFQRGIVKHPYGERLKSIHIKQGKAD